MEVNHTAYQLAIYAPLIIVFAFGLFALFARGIVMPFMAIALPTLIGAAEMLCVLSTAASEESVVTDILFVQAGGFGIIAMIFLLIHFVIRPVYRKVEKRLGNRHRPNILT